jgi:ribosomal protein S27AE
MKELKCPHCGGELEEDDCHDMSIWDDSVVRSLNGFCLNCGKSYQWTEHYNFASYGDVEEV